jgi:hypothetical protein
MNISLITTLLWLALALGILAAVIGIVIGTVRVVRSDRRPTSDVAWTDWREEQLWRNLRVS